MEKMSRHELPPALVDINPIQNLANSAILTQNNVDLFAAKWKEVHDLKRDFSWEIVSQEQLAELCIKLGFRGIYISPEENAKYIWQHELAHKEEAERLGISSVIRISELLEPHHSRYSAYLDFNMDDLMRVTNRKLSKVLEYMGRMLMAPQKAGCGYQGETRLAQLYLDRADLIRKKEFLSATFLSKLNRR